MVELAALGAGDHSVGSTLSDITFLYISFRNSGEVQEWLNWQHWKCCERETVPWVRIPPSPPLSKFEFLTADCEIPKFEIRNSQFSCPRRAPKHLRVYSSTGGVRWATTS